MSICYRTPNCIFVNVGQPKPKYYRKPFHIRILDYIYARIVSETFHLKGQDNRSSPSLAS